MAGRITRLKNSRDTIGNRTRDLPACSAVPQPTALPHAPNVALYQKNDLLQKCSEYLVHSIHVAPLVGTGLDGLVHGAVWIGRSFSQRK